jgi:hypothetical protein
VALDFLPVLVMLTLNFTGTQPAPLLLIAKDRLVSIGGVAVGVKVTVGVKVAVGVPLTVGVKVAVGVKVSVGVGVFDGVGV